MKKDLLTCRVFTRLTEDEYDWFQREANNLECSRATLLRAIILRYKHNKEAGGASVYELTRAISIVKGINLE